MNRFPPWLLELTTNPDDKDVRSHLARFEGPVTGSYYGIHASMPYQPHSGYMLDGQFYPLTAFTPIQHLPGSGCGLVTYERV